jgi:type IV pilus assembly protein PilC
MSRSIRDNWVFIILGFAAVVFILSNLWKRSPKFREIIDRTLLKAPIFGPIMHKSALARFSRTTSTMFAAGVPMVEALDSVAGATGSVV